VTGIVLFLALAFAEVRADTDTALPLAEGDKADLRLCEAIGYQGGKCTSLMDRLCSSIQNRNSKCLSYQMSRCHEGGKDRIHSTECLPAERRLCEWTNYRADEYVCELFLEEKCRLDGFKSRRCLLLRRKLTVEKNEDRLAMNLSTSVLGHRSSIKQRALLEKAIDALDQQIRDIDKSLSQVTIELTPEMKSQLQKNRRELQKQHDDLVPVFKDATEVMQLCEAIRPLQDAPAETFDPQCSSDTDSRCPRGLHDP
jgi:hypothetical protein